MKPKRTRHIINIELVKLLRICILLAPLGVKVLFLFPVSIDRQFVSYYLLDLFDDYIRVKDCKIAAIKSKLKRESLIK